MDRKSDNIITEVSNLELSIADIKTTQQASGDSFVNYSVSSVNPYDFSVSLTTNAPKAFRITFTHSEPLKYNIVDISLFMRVDNSDVMANPYVSNATPLTTEIAHEKPQLGKTTWIVDCSNIDFTSYPTVRPHTFYFKFYFNGTVSGTFSAIAI